MGITNFVFADYPIVGYSYLADPGAIWYEGRLYVYCSNDNENPLGGSSYEMSTIVCVSSADLKNWTNHGVVFNTDDVSWCNLSWAPSPVYKNGKFYLYYGNGGSAIGVAEADNPLGPFKDPVGRSIASSSTPGVQPFDGWLFDPMTFVDDDGEAYMYFGGKGENNMRVAHLNSDMISINGSCGKIKVRNLFEAAWLHKYKGKYYLSYSTDPSNGMRIDYMVSNNPMTGFTYGGVISDQPPINNNNNHQAIVEIDGEWYQVYHNRIVARDNLGTEEMPYHRNLAIDKFTHNADGTINKMKNTVDGVKQLKYLDPYVRQEGETMSDQSGIDVTESSAGGMALGYIDSGDWTMVEGVDFGSSGANSFSASVSSPTGGEIQIRLGSPTGTLIGTLTVPNTGAYGTWKNEVVTLSSSVSGVKNVYFVFSKGGFDFDHWMFYSSGPIASITSPQSSDAIFAGDEITISASAEAQDGTIVKVEFFVDGESIGVADKAPYSTTYVVEEVGEHKITAVATDSQGEEGSTSLTIKVNIPQGPYGGTPHAIPGKIELEEFDVGGNGFAYNDADAGSKVEPAPDFRSDEDVDIEKCEDTGGGYNIGWTAAGEWLEYTVDVKSSGLYDLVIRGACDEDGRTVSFSIDGDAIASNVEIDNTGGWQEWEDFTVEDVELSAGEHILRLTIGSEDYVNLNYVEFLPLVAGPSVNIVSPSSAASLFADQTVTLSADVETGDSPIESVSFYANGDLLGSDDTAPYSYSWSGMEEGTYKLKVEATDEGGIKGSNTVTVNVGAPIPGKQLKEGWNLVGCTIQGTTEISEALSSIWEYVEVVKNMDAFYDKTVPANLILLNELEWGGGYFIKVSADCKLAW